MPATYEPRWFRRLPQDAARRVWRESLTTRHGALEATLRLCDDGGCVVTCPALPQLMVHGATVAHARIKALALVDRYLRGLERPPALPLAA